VLVPCAQHDATHGRAVELELVHGRAMRVAVDQHARAAGAHGGGDCALVHIHDVGGRVARVAAAAVASLLRQQPPHSQRQREETALPAFITDQASQVLIGTVGGAERIAVREQHTLAVGFDDDRIAEQPRAAELFEAPLQQEIPIAVHDIAGHAGGGEPSQRFADAATAGILLVIADP